MGIEGIDILKGPEFVRDIQVDARVRPNTRSSSEATKEQVGESDRPGAGDGGQASPGDLQNAEGQEDAGA